MWLRRRQVVFQPPPCICDQVEQHVCEAIAMRDEMARWKTPLEEWLALQVMPVLKLKSEPKPVEDVWAAKYMGAFNRSTQVSSVARAGIFIHSGTSARDLAIPAPKQISPRPQSGYYIGSQRVGPSYSPPAVDLSVSSLAILPCDGDVQPGAILKRGNGWYKVLSVNRDRMTVQRYY